MSVEQPVTAYRQMLKRKGGRQPAAKITSGEYELGCGHVRRLMSSERQ